MKNEIIYNCHIHTFTEQDVPRDFLPLGLVRLLATKVGYKFVTGLLKTFNFISSEDQFKKYAQFASIGKLGSQEEIFLNCAKYYPENTKFILLAVDMRYMNAGKIPRKYNEQLNELEKIFYDYPDRIIPFVHIDPNNREVFYIEDFLSENPWIRGIKLYPPIGHYPNDERLTRLYKYCSAFNLPIIAHCGPISPTHNKSSKKDICKLLNIPYDKEAKKLSKMELCAKFAHPKNYISILEQFPNLKICLAHWGSEISWQGYMENPNDKNNWLYDINEMMKKYPNLYTDVSFSLNNTEYFSVLKILLLDEKIRERVLFGSDYYMVQTTSSEKRFSMDLRAYLGEDLWKQISNTNPKRFLNIK